MTPHISNNITSRSKNTLLSERSSSKLKKKPARPNTGVAQFLRTNLVESPCWCQWPHGHKPNWAEAQRNLSIRDLSAMKISWKLQHWHISSHEYFHKPIVNTIGKWLAVRYDGWISCPLHPPLLPIQLPAGNGTSRRDLYERLRYFRYISKLKSEICMNQYPYVYQLFISKPDSIFVNWWPPFPQKILSSKCGK